MRVSVLLKWLLIMICTGTNQVYAYSGIDLISTYPNAELFKRYQKGHQSYHLVSGTMRYITDQSGNFDEGYAPEFSTLINGRVEKSIFDHTEFDSAIEIAKNMRSELLRKGFEIEYECSGLDCGDVAGWRLYLSRYADGVANSQHYIMAKHPGKNGGEWAIAFYVNEFSGIPRSIIHIVDSTIIKFEQYTINQDHLGVWLREGQKVALEGLYFEFNSDRISNNSNSVLTSLIAVLSEMPDMNISIEGHTDNVGSADYNLTLSLRRAESVKQYLVDKGIDEARLSVEGFGETKPKVNGSDSISRQKNRRVEVMPISKLKTEEVNVEKEIKINE
ncbi:OmpA family protein [Marinibactrum halimedae]|uniref:OmpA-like domain-containing protein n=1 Tax=Marinibactrum halimedae TaxID=1444977 RepID=A0AA37T599_9GAMM|nr:OmpA family protein [Marinibactrum halimedae]MCD9460298.1 OmpA family protein [Marinibactrum halimedae]GLS24386.1 hypothetical protein GCM10007877_00970 [Marinibactrum halimedae]